VSVLFYRVSSLNQETKTKTRYGRVDN
jgi:hypothetical protein